MFDRTNNHLPWVIAGGALMIFLLAGLVGGPDAAFDVNLIHVLAASRATHQGLTALVVPLTNTGGAAGMIAILVLVIIMLALQRQWKQATLFAGTVLGGRLVVEAIKLVVNRPRPAFDAHPVRVTSLSFPSAHSANSMITFLAIALLIVPPRYRVQAVTAAVILSGVVGTTRPYLGVHWPSDVVGGWAFGVAWVVSLAKASHYWLASDASPAI